MNRSLLSSLSEALVFLMAFIFVLTTAAFAGGLAISQTEAGVVLVLSLALVYGLFGGRVFIYVALLSILSSLLAGSIYDNSFDGQVYHQGAVAALAAGWNPLRAPFDQKYLVDDAIGFGTSTALWITHYPKASWIVEAVIFKVSNAIQMAKMINLIGIIAAFGITFGLFSRYLSAIPALVLALVAALNPISVAQVFTFYNDCLSASLLLILVVSLTTLSLSGKWRDVPLPAAAITLLANLKFSILGMAVVLCIFGAVAVAVRFRVDGFPKIITLGALGIVSTVLLGWSPYIQNLLGFGHPFYPLMGPNAVDIMSGITPAGISNSGLLTKFIIGNFSSPGSGDEIRWIPDRTSMAWAGLADTRLGGFGVLALVIGVMSVIGTMTFNMRSRYGAWGAYAVSAIAVSVAINPENWWARYIPQLWILPVIVAFILITLQGRRERFGWLMVVVMACNIAVTTSASVRRSVSSTIQISSQDDAIIAAGGRIQLAPGWFYGVWKRLADRKIDIIHVSSPSELSCPDPNPVAASYGMAFYCVVNQ